LIYAYYNEVAMSKV